MRRFGYGLITVAPFLGPLAVLLTVFYVRGEASTARVAICDRGNIIRADRLIDTRDPDDTPAERRRVPRIFPLLDCAATAGEGREIVLSPGQARRFVDLVARSRRPVVRDGQVVGSQPFPAAAAPRL